MCSTSRPIHTPGGFSNLASADRRHAREPLPTFSSTFAHLSRPEPISYADVAHIPIAGPLLPRLLTLSDATQSPRTLSGRRLSQFFGVIRPMAET